MNKAAKMMMLGRSGSRERESYPDSRREYGARRSRMDDRDYRSWDGEHGYTRRESRYRDPYDRDTGDYSRGYSRMERDGHRMDGYGREPRSREMYMEGRAGRDDDDGWHLSGRVSVPDQDVKLDEHTAKEWVQQMDNADGTKGPHWSMEQTKQVAAQKGVSCDPLEFWVTMNMMYSDYCVLAKKHNVNTIDFYVDMAKAFLDDKDARADKLARYYWAVVE